MGGGPARPASATMNRISSAEQVYFLPSTTTLMTPALQPRVGRRVPELPAEGRSDSSGEDRQPAFEHLLYVTNTLDRPTAGATLECHDPEIRLTSTGFKPVVVKA